MPWALSLTGLGGREAEVGEVLMQCEAAEVVPAAELLDPRCERYSVR